MKKSLFKTIVMLSKYFAIGFLVQFIAFSTLFGKSVDAQMTATVSANLHDVSVEKVFDVLSDAANVTFVYDVNDINKAEKVSISGEHMNAGEVLAHLSKKLNFSYKKIGNTITVKKDVLVKELPLLTGGSPTSLVIAGKKIGYIGVFKDITVSGTVTDSLGNPLIGVTVQVKGTSKGAVTDANGHFEIAAAEDAVLVFSYVGYQTKEVAINGRETVSVELSSGATGLNELVVVGYGTQKKKDLSGAITQVSGEKLENRPIVNVGEGLEGVVPNLQVSSGNAPGQGSSFNIRGFTSINGGSPLVLVDGVVEDPNLINPNDIESITVLKDAASAAIYGARAAYGVILITTKSGNKNHAPTVRMSSSYSINDLTRHPKYVNSLRYINYMDSASINAGNGPYFSSRIRNGVEAYFNDPENNLPVLYDPSIDIDGKYEYVGNTDWADVLYEKGHLMQNNISLSGGSEHTSYYLSYGHLKQTGFLSSYDDYYERHNINISVNSDLAKWLNLSGKVRYTYSYQDHPSGGAGGNSGLTATSGQLKNDLRPLMPVRHPDGHFAGQGSFTNPFAVGALGGHSRTKINDLWLTGAAVVRPIENLNLHINYSFNPYSRNDEFTSRLFEEYHADGSYNIYPWTNPNLVQLDNNNDYYHALNLYADYSRSFGGHNFKLMVGYNEELKKTKWYLAKRTNLIVNDLPVLNRATGQKTVDETISSWAISAGFFRLNYDYKGKYILEVNGRYDGSSKFPSGDRFVFNPSVSGAWRISDEKFWKLSSGLSSIVNSFKVRASYGSLGNQNVGSNFPYISSYGINTALPYILGDGSSLPVAVSPGGLVSPSFTWEKVKQWDVGADLGLFNNRLSLSYDYYIRYTNGMLTEGEPLPGVLGTGVPQENAADLKTKGWDLSISWKNRVNKDISYSASLVLSNSNAFITKFDNPTEILSSYYDGYKIGQIWGFETAGLFQSKQEVQSWVDQSQLYGGQWNPGDVKYKDLDGDGKITNGDFTATDHGDLKIIGNSRPHFLFGVNGSFNWKHLGLRLFLQGVGKQNFVPTYRFYGINSQWDVPMRLAMDYWSYENRDGFLPRPYINGGHGNRGGLGGSVDRYLQNAAYVRLKQLTVSYTFNNQWLRKARIQDVKIYFTGHNIATLTKLSKLYDPENLSLMGYPETKSYSFGINITLK